MSNKIVIHNIAGECTLIVANICDILMLEHETTANDASMNIYNIYIDIDHANLVPFMIRFFHKIDDAEYERIEII